MIGYPQIEHASLTDVGVRRGHNEDAHGSMLASDPEQWRQRGHVFVVADGMGAHAVGELASKLAIDNILLAYSKHAHQGAVAALRRAFLEANSTIHARGQQNPEFAGMGTTTTALLLRPDGAWVGHVGDSRAYRVRGEQIEQLTFDHSLLWELARRQQIAPDLLQRIPSNVILRSLGPEPLVQVDIEGPHPGQPGDLFVLCSDGLSGQISDHEIGAISSVLPPAEACRFLIDLANLRGGPDNITVLVVRVGAEGAGPPAEGGGAGWPRWLPWPYAALSCGVLLAGSAVALMSLQLVALVVLILLAAAGLLLAGAVGLAQTHAEEKRRSEEELPPTELRVHAQSSCKIELPLLEKLTRAAETVKQQLQERGWDADWAAHQQRTEEANKLLDLGDVAGAFRQHCRATRVLTEAWHRQRQKEEALHEAWEKHPGVPAVAEGKS